MIDISPLILYMTKQYILFELYDKKKQTKEKDTTSDILDKSDRFRKFLCDDKDSIQQLLIQG